MNDETIRLSKYFLENLNNYYKEILVKFKVGSIKVHSRFFVEKVKIVGSEVFIYGLEDNKTNEITFRLSEVFNVEHKEDSEIINFTDQNFIIKIFKKMQKTS